MSYRDCGCIEEFTSFDNTPPDFKASIHISEQNHLGEAPIDVRKYGPGVYPVGWRK
tara:strand:- start:7239 stop:7406 length:168 start_codon:yes stop_codon:yes gene_type:complete